MLFYLVSERQLVGNLAVVRYTGLYRRLVFGPERTGEVYQKFTQRMQKTLASDRVHAPPLLPTILA
jgi:hypothetical protein